MSARAGFTNAWPGRRAGVLGRKGHGCARRGIALADFLAGTLIFSGVLLVYAGMTRSKFELLGTGELRARALAAAEAELDRVRVEGLGGRPEGEADADGFRLIRAFEPRGPLPRGRGIVAARALRVEPAEPHGLYEARITILFRESSGEGRLSLSTVATLPGAAR